MNLGVYNPSAITFVDIHLFGRDNIEKDNGLCEKVLETLSDDANTDGLRAILYLSQKKIDEPDDLAKIGLLLTRSWNGGSIYGKLAMIYLLSFIRRRIEKCGIVLPDQPLELTLRQVVNVHRHPYALFKLATLLKRKYESWYYYNETVGVPQEVVDEFNALIKAAAEQGFVKLW
jgi:hypothetical protein